MNSTLTGVIYVSDASGIPQGAKRIKNWPGYWIYNNQIYCDQSSIGGIFGGGASSSPASTDDLFTDEELRQFSNDVVDIVDITVDDILDIKETDERLRDSLRRDIKADAFDKILDRLGDILDACS